MFYLKIAFLALAIVLVLYVSTFVPLKYIKKSFLQDYNKTIEIINASGNWELRRDSACFGYLLKFRAEELWLCHKGPNSANYDLRLLAKQLQQIK